jgi:heme/copper-type cytochrome/quinol oxidase subunit 3
MSQETHASQHVGFRGLDVTQLGVIVFVSSEAFFFLTLIISYIAYHPVYVPERGPTPQQALNVPLTALFTVFLFSSSFTMGRATSLLGRLDVSGARRWLVVTVILGAVFLAGQAYEYSRLYQDSIRLGTNVWTSTFFTLTGFHGLHVLIGLISILIATSLVQPLGGIVRGARAVEGVSIYWHFVDAVWVVIFPVVYLWTLIS